MSPTKGTHAGAVVIETKTATSSPEASSGMQAAGARLAPGASACSWRGPRPVLGQAGASWRKHRCLGHQDEWPRVRNHAEWGQTPALGLARGGCRQWVPLGGSSPYGHYLSL